MIKSIIFDIDGVLIDSFEANLKFFQNIFKKNGFKIPTKHDYKKAFHLTMFNALSSLAKTNNIKVIEKLKKTAILYRKEMYPIKMLKITKNSSKTIKQLSKKYKLALVTSRMEQGVNDYLNISGTKNFFKIIVHHSHFKNPKPHPESLLIALKKLKVKPKEAIYVGDSATDIEAAKAASMRVILYNKKSFKNPDYKISNLDDLPKIISKIEKESNINI